MQIYRKIKRRLLYLSLVLIIGSGAEFLDFEYTHLENQSEKSTTGDASTPSQLRF
jgi:hypothetical protein